MSSKFLREADKAISAAWREADRKAREEAFKEQLQNKLDGAEPYYCHILDVVHEAVHRRAADLEVLAYGNPDQHRIWDRPGVIRHSDHIRIANGCFYFAVVIRRRRLRRSEPFISVRDFMERFQDALDEVTTFWGYPDIRIYSVSKIVRITGNFWGVVLT